MTCLSCYKIQNYASWWADGKKICNKPDQQQLRRHILPVLQGTWHRHCQGLFDSSCQPTISHYWKTFINVSCPEKCDLLMAGYWFSFQEMKSFFNCLKVSISFLDIRVPSSEMGRNEAKTGVVVIQTHSNPPLVTRHATQSSLLHKIRTVPLSIKNNECTFLEEPSTFLITGVNSDLTITNRAVPTS